MDFVRNLLPFPAAGGFENKLRFDEVTAVTLMASFSLEHSVVA